MLKKVLAAAVIIFIILIIQMNRVPKWMESYREVLEHSNLITDGIEELKLADLNLNGVPELFASYLINSNNVYGIKDSKVVDLGFANIEELALYRNLVTGEYLWISKFTTAYKYGNTYSIDLIKRSADKVGNKNIFIYNEDIRQGLSYWEHNGELMSQEEYLIEYNQFWEQLEKVEVSIPTLRVEEISNAEVKKFLNSWRALDSSSILR